VVKRRKRKGNNVDIEYKVTPTFAKVHRDTSRYIFVMGPVSSGKSTGCIFHVLFNAMKQKPDDKGVRYSRYAVIRATYPALKSTIIKSWIEWFKDKITITYSVPIRGRIRYPMSDGTILDIELFFIATNDAKAAEKLRSLELTGAHVNEASEIDPDVYSILKTRVNRFPAERSGGCVDPFIISDYNAVSTSHWLYKLAEEEKPEGYSFYRQPPAVLRHVDENGKITYTVNPEAENLLGNNKNYYEGILPGSSPDFIEVNLMNNYGEVRTGKPVYKDYDDSYHTSSSVLVPTRNLPVIIGLDLGLTPACVFTQQQFDGTVIVFDEITTEDCTIQEFIEDLLWPRITSKYPYIIRDFKVVVDPAAQQRAITNGLSPYHLLKQNGLNVKLGRDNDVQTRLESVAHFLRLRDKFKISPECKMLRKGFISEYKYRKINSSETQYKDKPEKNIYSHVHDALQYAMMEYVHKPKRKPFHAPQRRYTAVSMVGGY
jgi:hypothetical protein